MSPIRRCSTWIQVALATLAVLVVAPRPAAAQFERSAVVGTIVDQQGGVVPGVTVTAVNAATKQTRSTVTDASGLLQHSPARAWAVRHHPPNSQGFKKAQRAAVQLDASAPSTMDFTLETGALTEVVTVTAEAPPLQTDVALRKTVEAKDIEQLSFSGRNPIGVAGLKAGVIGGSFNNYGFSTSATAASTSTAAAPTRTTSPSTARPPSARDRPAPSSASRTSTPSRKSRS